MKAEVARWILSVALYRHREGSQLLRTYAPVMNEEYRTKVTDMQAGFRKVVAFTTNRLVNETLA